jgi:hypothetical protein
LVGVAVNVTLVPEHIVLPAALEAIFTLAGKFGFTFIVTALLVAGLPVAQVVLEVITTVTTALSAKVVEVKVRLLVPTLVLPIFH